MALLFAHIAKREGISVMILAPIDNVELAMRASMGVAIMMALRVEHGDGWTPINSAYAASLVQGRTPIW